MNFAICPNGSGEINVHMSRNEANELADKLQFVITEFDWDDYSISSFRNAIERAVRSTQEGQEDVNTNPYRAVLNNGQIPVSSSMRITPPAFQFDVPDDADDDG